MMRKIIWLNLFDEDDPYHIQGVYKKDDMRELLHLIKPKGKLKRPKSIGRRNYENHRFNVHDTKQFCITKMRYSTKRNSHSKFLKTYLTQEDKDNVLVKPKTFGFSKNEYQAHMVEKHFKFIISPDNQHVDTEILVKELVRKMEQETGYRFYWTAAEHTDTMQKHAHLLINGVDQNGKDISFSPHFVKNKMRNMTRNICTMMVGERTEKDIALAKERAFTANRFIQLDDQIQNLCHAITDNKQYGFVIKNPSNILQKRLAHLCKLGIAVKGNNSYQLETNWSETLKAVGRYNTFLSSRKELSRAYDLSLYTDITGSITGTIKKVITMNDEEVWNNAVIVENESLKKAWYVPLYYPFPQKHEGKEINCSMEKSQKGLLTPSIKVKGEYKTEISRREMNNHNIIK
jgi:hypothetical protein